MIRLEALGRCPVGGQPKRVALLAYLALARPQGEHRRDMLLALFWPELDAGRARAALRQALHALRAELGAGAVTSRGTEVLALDRAAFSCDVWELEAAAAAGDHARVVALYRGDLLPGLHLSDAPAFEHWLDGERAHVRDIVQKSAWAVAESASDAASVGAAVRFAIGLSSFDESAIRRGMQLLVSAGERAAAMALYEEFAAEVRAELDAEPSATTRRLADDVRRSEIEIDIPRFAPRPIIRERQRRRIPRGVVAAAAILLAMTAASRIAGSAPDVTDPRRVRVEAFVNATGSRELDTLAGVVTARARDGLVNVDAAQVLSRAAADDRAGTIVRGSVRRDGPALTLRAEVVDRASGAIVRSVVVSGRDADSLAGALTDRVKASVATALYPGWGMALSQPPSYAGYRAFLDGMHSIKREQHDSALAAFRRAFADSSFTAAGLLAASELYQLKRFASAESLVVAIARRRADLPAVDARLLDWLELSLRGDRIGARAAMRAITTLAPAADLAWLQLAIDNVETARPREALDALDHIDRDAEFGDAWLSYWATRAEALHIAGDHERELAVVREALALHPEMRVLQNYELRALAALGRVREVDAGARALSGGIDPATTLRQTSLELAAHGHAAEARALLDRVSAMYNVYTVYTSPSDSAALLAFRLGRARTLYLADDRSGARAIYDSLLREHPRCLDCVGALAVLSARAGDGTAARAAAARLAAARKPYLFGRHLLWEARILAALGDIDGGTRALNAAFAAGAEFDVMTHTDPDLVRLRPDSLYRVFARASPR